MDYSSVSLGHRADVVMLTVICSEFGRGLMTIITLSRWLSFVYRAIDRDFSAD